MLCLRRFTIFSAMDPEQSKTRISCRPSGLGTSSPRSTETLAIAPIMSGVLPKTTLTLPIGPPATICFVKENAPVYFRFEDYIMYCGIQSRDGVEGMLLGI